MFISLKDAKDVIVGIRNFVRSEARILSDEVGISIQDAEDVLFLAVSEIKNIVTPIKILREEINKKESSDPVIRYIIHKGNSLERVKDVYPYVEHIPYLLDELGTSYYLSTLNIRDFNILAGVINHVALAENMKKEGWEEFEGHSFLITKTYEDILAERE